MGNILFLIGITLLLGPSRTFVFFARRNKWKGTLAFWAGVLLILMRWPLIGFAVEMFGIFVLFGVSFLLLFLVMRGGEERRGMESWRTIGRSSISVLTRCDYYRSFSRRLRVSRTISPLWDLIWRAGCRLLETRLVRTKGRIRICLYKKRILHASRLGKNWLGVLWADKAWHGA